MYYIQSRHLLVNLPKVSFSLYYESLCETLTPCCLHNFLRIQLRRSRNSIINIAAVEVLHPIAAFVWQKFRPI